MLKFMVKLLHESIAYKVTLKYTLDRKTYKCNACGKVLIHNIHLVSYDEKVNCRETI